jgi:hypothetical protein
VINTSVLTLKSEGCHRASSSCSKHQRIAMTSSANGQAGISVPSRQRSKITNGHAAVLPGVDGRSAKSRRFKDIASQIIADQAGLSECSEARLQLIRRFAASAVLAEELEARLANGEEIDVQEHSLLCSTLTRLAARIGIDRRSKLIGSTLSDYLHMPAETEDAEVLP